MSETDLPCWAAKHITDKVGALVKPMYVKDIKLKSLTSTKFIKDVKDRTPKKTIKQVFRTKAGEIIEKEYADILNHQKYANKFLNVILQQISFKY